MNPNDPPLLPATGDQRLVEPPGVVDCEATMSFKADARKRYVFNGRPCRVIATDYAVRENDGMVKIRYDDGEVQMLGYRHFADTVARFSYDGTQDDPGDMNQEER